MNSQKLSLNSPTFNGRIKKYDAYVHRPDISARKINSVQNSYAQVKSQKIVNPLSVQPTKPAAKIQKAELKVDALKPKQFNQKTSVNYIAHQSIKSSKQFTDSEGIIHNQFADEMQVEYAQTKPKSSRFQKAMYAFGVIVFVFSALVSMQTFITNSEAKDQIATLGLSTDEQGVSQGTGNEPSEDPVSEDAIYGYKVAPEDPRYIRIPQIGVLARIKNLGIDSKGAVDAPWNIHDAGWYNGSARPGNSIGSSLILGHVSGWTKDGVFKKLSELPTGAKFEIEKGSGEVIKYETVKSENLPLDQIDMAKVLSSEEQGVHDLKLMTCSGSYNRETETYDSRLIVYAKRVY